MTNIFIGNTPAEQCIISKWISWKTNLSLFRYHSKQDTSELSENPLYLPFSLSLITHEEIYLKPTTVLLLMERLGINWKFLNLLRAKSIKDCALWIRWVH